jgi:LCP family protein required for cell wall assembly
LAEQIGAETGSAPQPAGYEKAADLAEALLGKQVNAIIMNGASIALLIEEEAYETFLDKVKILYSVSYDALDGKDTEETKPTDPVDPEKNVTNTPFVMYVSGSDTRRETLAGFGRNDVNILAAVNPQTKQILLVNTPRDSRVEVPGKGGAVDKLTHCGMLGINSSILALESIYNVDIQYYAQINFTGFEKLINAIGGIEVYSPKAFKSSISDYEYEEGWNYMGGKEALYFARERKAFNNEDDKRVENQQAVLKAVLNKMMTSPSLLTSYPELLEIAAEDLETNMSSDDMQALVRMQLADLGEWDIEMQKITGEYDMDYVASLTQEQKFQVYRPDDAAVAECLDNIDRVMNPTPEELQAIEEEQKKSNFINFLRKIKGGSSEETEENE